MLQRKIPSDAPTKASCDLSQTLKDAVQLVYSFNPTPFTIIRESVVANLDISGLAAGNFPIVFPYVILPARKNRILIKSMWVTISMNAAGRILMIGEECSAGLYFVNGATTNITQMGTEIAYLIAGATVVGTPLTMIFSDRCVNNGPAGSRVPAPFRYINAPLNWHMTAEDEINLYISNVLGTLFPAGSELNTRVIWEYER
jgi:hypothetical protein